MDGHGTAVRDTDPVERQAAPDVTRLLAAAAYSDETFRDEVIVQTLHEKYRFIGPSYGVNIGCVVRHCIASRWLSRRRDVMLTVLLIVGLWALQLPPVVTVAVFVGALLVALALTSRKTKLRWRILLSVVAYLGISAFVVHRLSFFAALLALLVVAADIYERRYRVVARRMNAQDFDPDAPAYGRERPSERASDERRIAHLTGHQDGNVVVYSGYYPFIGSGFPMLRRSWSFAIDVTKAPGDPGGSDPVAPIEASELYAHVEEEMRKLDIEGSSVTHRYYVHGRFPGRDRDLFFHPKAPHERFPRLRYVIDEVSKLEAHPQEMVRRYADIKVAAWQSELILSAFVRFSRTSDYLFIEVTYFILPPLKGEYYEIHRFNRRPTPHEFSRLVLDSFKAMPLLWLKAPLRVAKWMARPIGRARREQQVEQEIRENRRFDFGALGSVRELGADDDYAKYFQEMDIEQLYKVIDQHLFKVIRTFLKDKGVDTSQLERSIQAIINKGIWIAGDQKGNIAENHSVINDMSGAANTDGEGSAT
jgi:hypothetical protein